MISEITFSEFIPKIFDGKIEVKYSLEVINSKQFKLYINKECYVPITDEVLIEEVNRELEKSLSTNKLNFNVDLDTKTVEISNVKIPCKTYETRKKLFQNLDDISSLNFKIRSLNDQLTYIQAHIKSSHEKNSKSIELKNTQVDKFIKETRKEIDNLLEKIEYGINHPGESHSKLNTNESNANASNRVITENEIKYMDIKGDLRYCKGKDNGCINCNGGGTLWGSNPYTMDDGGNYCKAALHCGVLESSGGYFVVKKIGQHPSYNSSLNNGIQSVAYTTPYNGYIILPTDLVEDATECNILLESI